MLEAEEAALKEREEVTKRRIQSKRRHPVDQSEAEDDPADNPPKVSDLQHM